MSQCLKGFDNTVTSCAHTDNDASPFIQAVAWLPCVCVCCERVVLVVCVLVSPLVGWTPAAAEHQAPETWVSVLLSSTAPCACKAI